MRLKLTIRPFLPETDIPLNYNYHLSSAIYRWIEMSSPEYSAFLHNQGFSPEGVKRRFKHFCFSQLMVSERTIQRDRLVIRSPRIMWYIGMPVEESLQHLVVGMFEKREFFIERETHRFLVELVETLPEPLWERRMQLRMLSPLTVAVPEDRKGKLFPRYLLADDPRLSEALRSNILNKYHSLYGKGPDDDAFRCIPDERFISQRGGVERITKLITIREGQSGQTRVRGFMCPLTIEGNPELIRLAYHSGLGEKNSMGFGMVEVVEARTNQTSTQHSERS